MLDLSVVEHRLGIASHLPLGEDVGGHLQSASSVTRLSTVAVILGTLGEVLVHLEDLDLLVLEIVNTTAPLVVGAR